MMTPKMSWLAPFATDKAVVIGTEDEAFWKGKPTKRVKTIDEAQPCETLILAEVLQKVDDPVAVLKKAKALAEKVVVVLPNEYSWQAQFQPLKNKDHKRFYDMMMLTEQLDEAGFDYAIELVEYAGWSFFGVQMTPHLNSEERRKRRRAAEAPKAVLPAGAQTSSGSSRDGTTSGGAKPVKREGT
jgi:hypothetical protein